MPPYELPENWREDLINSHQSSDGQMKLATPSDNNAKFSVSTTNHTKRTYHTSSSLWHDPPGDHAGQEAPEALRFTTSSRTATLDDQIEIRMKPYIKRREAFKIVKKSRSIRRASLRRPPGPREVPKAATVARPAQNGRREAR